MEKDAMEQDKIDDRYVMTVQADHLTVRLEDLKTNEAHTFSGHRALWHAVGVLAEWRGRDMREGS